MELSVEQLRKNYERFDDDKIIRIATQEAAGLRPEAVELLVAVIKERGISENVLRGLSTQRQQITGDEVDDYVEILRRLPCPLCGSNSKKLNASVVGLVVSFIVMTNYEKELKIACSDCLIQQHDNAIITSALVGWWGLPWGVIRTIQSFFFNAEMKKVVKEETASKYLRGFVLKNIGRIETHRNSTSELREIIEHV